MNFLAVHGSHVLELSPYVAKIDPNLSCFKTYPGKEPRDTVVLLFSQLDLALQSTVGERVARVELKVAFIGEEATSSLWGDFPDFLGGHNCGGEINEVLSSWFEIDALVAHHRELSWLANEHLEGILLLVQCAQGHRVGVEVQGELQSVPSSLLRFDFPHCLIPLQLSDQVSVF